MSVVLLKGNDDVLLAAAVKEKVDALVGTGDSSLMVEELTEQNYLLEDGSFAIRRLVDAAQTMPFLTERRVVVARHMGRFSKAADVEGLVDYLNSPVDTTDLVLVWEKGYSPKQDRLAAIPVSYTHLTLPTTPYV